MIVAYEDPLVTLLQGDCRDIAAPSEPYVVVTDPPFTISTPEHVREMLASFGWRSDDFVVLTNPAPGYLSPGIMVGDGALAPIGGPPTFERPLDKMCAVLPWWDTLIFDPFAGTGTTLVAARLAGKRAIGIERSEDAVRIACKRLRAAAYEDRTAGVAL